MKIVICGAGQVGFHLANYLSRDGHDISVVDQSTELIERVNRELDVQALVGHATFPGVLARAGMDDADMLIAVTLSDEVNMIACQVAHSLFNVPSKIARIRQQNYLDPAYSDLFSPNHMPIDHIISPEVEVAGAIFRRVRVTGAFNAILLDKVRVIGVRAEGFCPIIHTPLRQLTSLFPNLSITVMAIMREGRLIIPSSREQMLPDDLVYFAVDEAHVGRAMAAFGYESGEARRVIIIGGGNIGVNLTRKLLESGQGYRIKIIERSHERANKAAETLPSSVDVIKGDGLEPSWLEEAGIAKTELSIAVTEDDETNVLCSLLAKSMSNVRTVALTNKASYGSLVSKLGVDVTINPREITASSILQHVRKGRVKAIHSLLDGQGEVMLFEALPSSPMVGMELRESPLPDKSIIGALIRGDEVLIPRPDTVIMSGDQVVLFSASEDVHKVERLFSVGLRYF